MADFVWGIIGPGWIATEFTKDMKLAHSARHRVGAVLGSSMESAEKFAKAFGATQCFDDIDTFVKEAKVDAVYIATPHPLHYRDTVKCLENKLPVLCEKPIAVNNKQYKKMKATAQENNVFLMEGMWIRFLPSITKTLDALQQKNLGSVKAVHSTISYLQEKDPDNRFYDPELGGGSLLDLGSYCIYLAMLFLGKPERIEAAALLTEKQIDTNCGFTFHYSDDRRASGHSTFNEDEPNIARIICENGQLEIADAWNEDTDHFTITYNDGQTETVKLSWEGHGFQYEIDEVYNCISQGKGESEKHSLDFTTDLMVVMDEIRAKSGIVYPYDEDPEALPDENNENRSMEKKITPQLLTKEVAFGEGPLWHPDGFLIFSDQVENCVKKLTPEGEISIYIDKSGCDEPAPHSRPDSTGSNALAWLNGKLLMCRHGSHSIAFYQNGNYETLADSYNGKPLNSPNDFIVSKNGTIFFTDPPYGIEGEKLLPEHRQPVAGLYALKNGELELLWDGMQYPNGVELSPDEKTFYISSAHEDDKGIYKAEMVGGKPQNFVHFADAKADGILIDDEGNLYTASGDFVYKFNPKGEKIEEFKIGVSTSNLAWGGADGKDLYITCYDSVWVIKGIK